MSEHHAESDYTDVVIRTEFGVRDWGGAVATSPDWQSPADVIAYLHKAGYTAYQREDVLTRTTTTTVTTTGWEAAEVTHHEGAPA